MQSTPPKRYQQLQPEDRVTLASLVQQKYSVRAMAQILGRSPSTISRELRRNAQPAGYASIPARTCAQRRRLLGRQPIKLYRDGILFGLMHHFLGQRWSPEQIALTLARIFPLATVTSAFLV
jgi:IS30 family transposase